MRSAILHVRAANLSVHPPSYVRFRQGRSVALLLFLVVPLMVYNYYASKAQAAGKT